MFWDASALVPALLPEARSTATASLLGSDRQLTLWWASPVECQSAIHRRQREGAISLRFLNEALVRLSGLIEDADFIAPSTGLRERAGRPLAAHPLRAADALQLAAALVWCNEAPQGEAFICLDDRLREAARREDFAVLPALRTVATRRRPSRFRTRRRTHDQAGTDLRAARDRRSIRDAPPDGR